MILTGNFGGMEGVQKSMEKLQNPMDELRKKTEFDKTENLKQREQYVKEQKRCITKIKLKNELYKSHTYTNQPSTYIFFDIQYYHTRLIRFSVFQYIIIYMNVLTYLRT